MKAAVHRLRILSIAALGLMLLSPAGAEPSSLTLTQTFLNPTPASFDQFGVSVAISGDNVLVGAHRDNTGAESSGAAYLFDAGTGNLLQTFLNPTPLFFDQFGFSVAISGDNVLVGAPDDDGGAVVGSGAAHLFDAGTGNLLQTFLNPTPAFNDQFGISVAISGDNVLVGAYRDDAGEIDSGAAYLFDAGTGNLLQTFLNPTPALGDVFGRSVAISGDNVLVGAPGDDDSGAEDAGAAYLFDAGTGNLLQTFLNPTPAFFDQFGNSVAISGDNVLVGAADDTGAQDTGAAYLFDAGTGNLLQTFLTPAFADRFGASVAISGDKVLVGARFHDGGADRSGAAYLFDAGTGNLLQTFLNPTPAIDDRFGASVAISGDNVLVGAEFDDGGADRSGAAYLYEPILDEPILVEPALVFPLDVKCGGKPCTPYAAKISSVMDHSGTPLDPNNPSDWYSKNSIVEAYTREKGEKRFGSNSPPSGYLKNAKGTPFIVSGNYTGVLFEPGPCKDGNGNTVPCFANESYLNYDGHSGYDYPYPVDTPIIAPAGGRLFKAAKDTVNHNSSCEFDGWEEWHTFYIVHENGFTTWYLHASDLHSKIKNEIDSKGSALVAQNQVVAFVGGFGACKPVGAHLHFEVRKGLDQVVDPYSEGLWKAKPPTKAMPWLWLLLLDD